MCTRVERPKAAKTQQRIKNQGIPQKKLGKSGQVDRFFDILEVSANFKWFAVSATMSQRKIHLTRMNSQNPLDITLTTADYIVPAVLPARANFMAHCDTCMAEWHQQSHKTIHVHRFDKHVDFNKLSFWPETVTEVQNFLILNNTGLIVAVGKLSEGKTPTVLFQ